MVSDNEIYDLGNVKQWPIHWTTIIKNLIFKINSTNDLFLETQIAKDKIENEIEEYHISGSMHYSSKDKHHNNIIISKRQLELLQNELEDKNYKSEELHVEINNLIATCAILQRKNTILHENSLKPREEDPIVSLLRETIKEMKPSLTHLF